MDKIKESIEQNKLILKEMKHILNKILELSLFMSLISCSCHQSAKEEYWRNHIQCESEVSFFCLIVSYVGQTYAYCSDMEQLLSVFNIEASQRVDFVKTCSPSILMNIPLEIDSLTFVRMDPKDLYDLSTLLPEEWEIYDNPQRACDTLHALFARKECTDNRVNYLIYKCWQQDIFASTSDETGPYYLYLYDAKQDMSYY